MTRSLTRFSNTQYLLIALCLSACQSTPHLSAELEEGRQLSLIHCSSCHLSPDPSLLDKPTWEKSVLPAMAQGLGIGVYMKSQYFPDPRHATQAPLSMEEWTKIVKFYLETAPGHLPVATPPVKLQKGTVNFLVRTPNPGQAVAATTLIHLDSNSQTLLTADAYTKRLQVWDKQLRPLKEFQLPAPVVNASSTGIPGDKNFLLTSIGVLYPTNKPAGSFSRVTLGDQAKKFTSKPIEGDLRRPVQTLAADFNHDGIMDYSVCSFGNTLGGLFLFTGNKDGTYTRSGIREVPGAEMEILGDFNNDGWPDLLVLFAQANEGIWMFTNNKQGGFTTRNIMRFPSVWGSTSIALCDFNNDGKPDILYTSGDNADYSPILKPYHGVYIYENTGGWHFKKSWFYPVNGCIKASPADFNGDKKMDIVSIAFAPDFKHRPQEACIYFEQDGPMHFSAHSLPVENLGHWLCMQVADIDHDGDPDVILGSFSLPQNMGHPQPSTAIQTKLPFVVLENQHIKSQPQKPNLALSR